MPWKSLAKGYKIQSYDLSIIKRATTEKLHAGDVFHDHRRPGSWARSMTSNRVLDPLIAVGLELQNMACI